MSRYGEQWDQELADLMDGLLQPSDRPDGQPPGASLEVIRLICPLCEGSGLRGVGSCHDCKAIGVLTVFMAVSARDDSTHLFLLGSEPPTATCKHAIPWSLLTVGEAEKRCAACWLLLEEAPLPPR